MKHEIKSILLTNNRYKILFLQDPIIKNEIKHKYCLALATIYPMAIHGNRKYLLEHFNICYRNYNTIMFAYFKDLKELRSFLKLFEMQYWS